MIIDNGALLAVFNSAHRVMKAEKLLKSCGCNILLIPAPRALMTDCGLAIRFNEDSRDNILNLLGNEDLLPVTLYQKIDDTTYQLLWSA